MNNIDNKEIIAIGVGLTALASIYISKQLWNGRSVLTPGKGTSDQVIEHVANSLLSNSKVAASPNLQNLPECSITIPHELESDYGSVRIQPFSPTWLQDYPQIIEHLETEHLLHVKGLDERGEGLTWHTDKFATDMDARLNPEAKVGSAQRGGFQMKLGYFIIPKENLETHSALSLSPAILQEVQEGDGYRFFVHPQAYEHFKVLHKTPGIKYVSPQESSFIGSPTSSYRSWVVRQVHHKEGVHRAKEGSLPFVVKLGVAGSVLGSDRWLSPAEIERSIQAQVAFDCMPGKHFKKSLSEGSEFSVFSESLGLVLKNISGYPSIADSILKESGILIREFPEEFLKGKCRIVSFAALMSPERTSTENHGIASTKLSPELQHLPLIFEIMAASIKTGRVHSPEEFIHKYLINGYLSAIERIVFEEGLTLEPHSQNLCMVLNPDYTPKGFAYRDHGGIWIDMATRGLQNKDISPFLRTNANKVFKTKGAISKGYIGSYSWFYRYQVFIKTLNTITHNASEWMLPPPGAPIQIGHPQPLQERNLQKYVIKQIKQNSPCHEKAIKTLNTLSLTLEQYHKAIRLLDSSYLELMNKYFELEKVKITLSDGTLPSAEGGSTGENVFFNHQGFLGKYRFNSISSGVTRISLENLPIEIIQKIPTRVITSFESQTFEDVKAVECAILDQGLCFFNCKHEVVAFMPYIFPGEKMWVEKQSANQ